MRDPIGAVMLLGAAVVMAGIGFSVAWSSALSSRLVGTGAAILIGLAAAVVAAAYVDALIAYSWRRAGGRSVVRDRSRAVQSGVLPPQADGSWLEALRVRRRNAQSYRWLFFVVAAVMLTTGLLRLNGSLPVSSVPWFVLAAAALLWGARCLLRGPRDAAVLDGFIAGLESRGPAPV